MKSRTVRYTHLALEALPLLQSQAIRLGNDRNNIDNLAQLLHDNHVNWAETVSSGADEVQAAVDAGILDVSVSHCGQLLAEVRAVLVLDVLDDRIPAAIAISQVSPTPDLPRHLPSLVVDLVSESGGIDDV